MLRKYDDLHEVTGVYEEYNESKYYALQWKWSQGNKAIKDLKIKIELNNKEANAVDSDASEKR